MSSAPVTHLFGRHPAAPESTLAGLPFVDLYLRIDGAAPARYNAAKGAGIPQGNHPVPESLTNLIEPLRQRIFETPQDEFGLTHDGMRLRAAKRRLGDGSLWAALRRIDPTFLDIHRLRLHKALVEELGSQGRRGGLLLLVGATGSGKSTTAAALLMHYLARYGGVAGTLEDPVEYDLQGPHGDNGYCFQSQVDQAEDWAAGIKSLLRWNPRYVFVGEIRTPAAAVQLLRAATSGPLVITTVHGGSIEHGLAGLLQNATAGLGERAAALLAESLVGVIHQDLTMAGPAVKFLFSDFRGSGDPVGSCIRDNQLRMLGTYVDQQRIQLLGS